MKEIPQHFKEAWQTIKRNRKFDDAALRLTDFIVWALAGWERSKFEREHSLYRPALPMDGVYPTLCHGCDYRSENCDPRHKMTDELWQQAARDKLEAGK
jgi:hypothetical protein